ncbi:MAG: hypothetical protein JNN28_15330, partial [Saprospiraceae bacterium]|nr:hypothetical protein [Saprospiraceae bacterium]
MRNTKRLLLIFLLAIGQISLTFSAETTTSDSPCFLQAPLNFKATHTGPNFVFLTWTPTAPGETYRIRLYRATDNQLYSTVDVQGSIGFKLLFMPSNKIHYAVIRGV